MANNNYDLGLIIALIKKLGGGGGTENINKQIADYISSHTNIPNGIAGLDEAGQVAPAQLPDRNHQLVLPYIVELTGNEMANAIDDQTEDYGTFAVGQLATPTTNDVFVVGHLYQYVSEEGVYNWTDLTETVQANTIEIETLPLQNIKIGDTVYANSYVIEVNGLLDDGTTHPLTDVFTQTQINLLVNYSQNVIIRDENIIATFKWLDGKGEDIVRLFIGLYTEVPSEFISYNLEINVPNNTYVVSPMYDYSSLAINESSTDISSYPLPLSSLQFRNGGTYYISNYIINCDFAKGQDLPFPTELTGNLSRIKQYPMDIKFYSTDIQGLFVPQAVWTTTANEIANIIYRAFDLENQGGAKAVYSLNLNLQNQTYILDVNDFQPQGVTFTNVSVPVSFFIADTTYVAEGFNYKATITKEGVNGIDTAIIAFSMADAMSGNYAPYCETFDGGVYIWAKEKPTTTLQIPRIEVIK